MPEAPAAEKEIRQKMQAVLFTGKARLFLPFRNFFRRYAGVNSENAGFMAFSDTGTKYASAENFRTFSSCVLAF